MLAKTWWRSGGAVTIAAGALVLILVAAISFWLSPRGPASLKPFIVWAELAEATDRRLIVTLAPAPTGSQTAPNPSGSGKRLNVILTPNTRLTADYYVGDFADNHRVHVQPLRVASLRPGIRLKLTVQTSGHNTVIARAVSWPQSINSGKQSASTAPNVKIPPLISPP